MNLKKNILEPSTKKGLVMAVILKKKKEITKNDYERERKEEGKVKNVEGKIVLINNNEGSLLSLLL